MLSTAVLKSAAAAGRYFSSAEEYYLQGSGLERSGWYGKGAAALGLSGPVDANVFGALLRGELPHGEQLGVKKASGEINHRPGFDLTFSVPKSVSLAALIGGDTRILAAVQRSADETLNHIERSCAQARRTINGVTRYEDTRNLVTAKFVHDISREGDPQLHIHAVIMNMTQRTDGAWRSLASKMGQYGQNQPGNTDGFIERVRHDRNYYGLIFRAQLAHELQQLGYTLEKKGVHGFFEIAGISETTLKAYSQRSEAIRQQMASLGLSGGKAAADLTLLTRKEKIKLSPAKLTELWQQTSNQLSYHAIAEIQNTLPAAGVPVPSPGAVSTSAKGQAALSLLPAAPSGHTIPTVSPALAASSASLSQPSDVPKLPLNLSAAVLATPASASAEISLITSPLSSQKALSAVNYALEQLGETQTVMREFQIIQTVLQQTMAKGITPAQVIRVLNDKQQQGELIVVPTEGNSNESNEKIFTTAALLAQEQDLLQAIHDLPKAGKPWLDKANVSAWLAQSDHTLSLEQRKALRTLMANPHTVGLLAGVSGSGKTHLLPSITELAKIAGFKPLILTHSGGEQHFLQNELKRTPQNLREWFKQLFSTQQLGTVSQFLQQPERLLPKMLWGNKPPLLMVENAQRLGTAAIHALAQEAQARGGRLLLTGDPQATLTWQRGAGFTQLMSQGAVCAELKQTQRALAGEVKEALGASLQQDIATAFARVGHRVMTIPATSDGLELMAAHAAGLTPAERKQTLVLLPSKAQCETMNELIRSELLTAGEMTATGHTATVLIPKALGAAGYRLAQNYRAGQWVRFNADFSSLQIKRGEYCRLVHVDAKQNRLMLENAQGQSVAWQPDKVAGNSGKAELFEEKQRPLAIGDTLQWRRNHTRLGLHNGERLQVKALNNDQLVLTRDNGKTVRVNLTVQAERHFDYGYAATPYQKPYHVADRVIAYQPSTSRQSHQRAFYQLLSQAKSQAWIYTDDKNKLGEQLLRHTGDKSSGLEAVLGTSALQTQGSLPNDYIRLLEKAVAAVLQKSQQAGQPSAKTPQAMAQEAVQYALAHLSEREAAFAHKEVMSVALQHSLLSVSPDVIQEAVIEAEKAGALIRGVYSSNGTRWTTREAIQMEREIVQLAQKDQGKLAPLVPFSTVQQYCAAHALSDEHTKVLQSLLTSTDRVTLIQGFAGTGKTTLLVQVEALLQGLQHAQTLAQQQGYTLLCLAPTHNSVNELTTRGLRAQTLDSFLGQQRNLSPTAAQHQPRYLLVVDEASMVSNRRLHEFLQCTHTLNARAVPVGDIKQYGAIEAGKPQAILQASGLQTLQLSDIQRQKHPQLLQAVHEIYQGKVTDAFKTLAPYFQEVSHQDWQEGREMRLETLSQSYLALSPVERTKTLVLSWGNAQRIELNGLIRQGLKAEGTLQGQEIMASTLVAKDMTQVEKTRLTNYCVGDVIRFGLAQPQVAIQKGQYWQIQAIDSQNNLLLLQNSEGKTNFWRPPRQVGKGVPVEVYQQQERPLCQGDLIRWTRTDKARGLINPELAQVAAILPDGKIAVQKARITAQGLTLDTQCMTLNPKEECYQHWDYSYAITGYSAQSRSIHRLLMLAESYSRHLTTFSAFLVGITRAIQELTIVTDNKEALLQQIQKNTGEKASALETIGSLPQTSPFVPSSSPSPQKPLRASRSKTTPAAEDKQTHFALNKPSIKPVTSPRAIAAVRPKNEASMRPQWDVSRIHEALINQAAQVVERLLGEPKVKRGDYYRYGSKVGSLTVTLKGEKRGLWHDFKTGEGGNLLKLIARENGLESKADFPKVLARAVQLLNVTEDSMKSLNGFSTNKKTPMLVSTALTDQQKKSIRYAKQLARESKTIKGTLAEKYLTEHRKINLKSYPDTVRFHPGIYSKANEATKPALLVVAHNAAGKVQAVQAIFLDEKTAAKADVNVKKQTWGMPSGAAVNLGKMDSSVTLVAEGPETALSVLQAVPNAQVKITLGKSNFKHIDPKNSSQNIVLCLDNDGHNTQSDQLIHEAAKKLTAEGKSVWLAKPEEAGKDYNDLLKEQGIGAIQNNIEQALSYQSTVQKQPIAKPNGLLNPAEEFTKLAAIHAKNVHRDTINQAHSLSEIRRLTRELSTLPITEKMLDKLSDNKQNDSPNKVQITTSYYQEMVKQSRQTSLKEAPTLKQDTSQKITPIIKDKELEL